MLALIDALVECHHAPLLAIRSYGSQCPAGLEISTCILLRLFCCSISPHHHHPDRNELHESSSSLSFVFP